MSTCQQTYKWWLPKVSAAAGLNPNFPNQDTNFASVILVHKPTK